MQKLLLLFIWLIASPSIACVPGYLHDNPLKHRPYVGTSCIYYGEYGGHITSGKYEGYVISNEMLSEF
ncbi:hypothetical protein SAMN05216419_10427 [Nitrosomonas cryotolerans]|uniref:Uncharacterized protein n=1 Tax=Nitrosomonas cryotolerans ATCC 49181 TaxID=1131553 RepID=A0A1N6F675_9PROT|nr:hypothetical protein SAMN05216419_10427 [Nitrosomonas cryotolerans]SIN90792.1 hypothetical protein SAMN02743940_0111 [Nitrosomonas cryotolerans ATCC 49181]